MTNSHLGQDDLKKLISAVALLRIEDVMRMTGMRSRDQIYRLVQRGDLAQPVKIGKRASAWHTRDVIRFIETRTVDPLAHPVKNADCVADRHF